MVARFHLFSPISRGEHRGVRTGHWSLQHREKDKHETYNLRTQTGTRNVANGRVVPVVANSYAAIGSEAAHFFQHANLVARRCGRSCADERLAPIVQYLVMYFVASGVLDAYTAKAG